MADERSATVVEEPEAGANGKPQVLVVTGMSGAGRSTAANVLEDLGYTVIDNLPPQLITDVVVHHRVPEDRRGLVVVVDSRAGLPTDAIRQAMLDLEQAGVRTLVLFLDAEDQAIIRRYEENRRPHPLRTGSLTEAISSEREVLAGLRDLADVVIDTTDLNVHQLRERIADQFAEGGPHRPMRVSVTTFGYKHGIPRDTDLLFDVRFLPNPHWVPELKPFRGTDRPVSDYVMSHDDARAFLGKVEDLLEFLLPRFEAEAKSYLSIGIGCTGGHHRSVALGEELARLLRERGIDAVVRHRDVDR